MSTSSVPSRRVRRLRAASTLAAAAALALAVAPSGALGTTTSVITYVSDTSWTAGDADGAVGPDLSATLPAAAQEVCLNDTYPSNCPAGATVYGYAGGGWGANDDADFSEAFPQARWIWAPGIDGTTTPADNDAYNFQKDFTLPWKPTTAYVWIAVDDAVSVRVNNDVAGTASGNASITKIDITDLVDAGPVEIVIRGTNGQICNTTCPYSENPGGILFGIAFVHASDGPTPPPTSTLDGTPAAPAPVSWLPVVLLAAGVVAAAAVAVPSRRRR